MNHLDDTAGYLDVGVDDLNLYFQHTFLKVRDKKEELPVYCYVHSFHNLGDNGKRVELAKNTDRNYFMLNLKEFFPEFSFPKVGVYNYKKTVIYLQRGTKRQFKKALCSSSVIISPIQERMMEFGPVPDMFRIRNAWSWTLANVSATFGNPHYMNLEEAHKAVSGCTVFARAITPEFYLTPGICTSYPALWYRNTFVANVPTPKAIEVTNPMLFQEVIDQFRKEGVQING